MNLIRLPVFKDAHHDGFTFIELLVVLATIAVLGALLLPALAGTKPNSAAFQCLENERQLVLGWQMYAEDNADLLAPNDYPYQTAYAYATAAQQAKMKNWVVGTMEQAVDAEDLPFRVGRGSELLDPNTLLSLYVSNRNVYHCPADNYIDPYTHLVHVRSYSMNSAVGTLYYSALNSAGPGVYVGAPVNGGWLTGGSYYASQTTWQTYGKMTSFTKPGPANTFVFMDENPISINDGALEISAQAAPGSTYLIDYPAGNHNEAAAISFADGHVLIHQWSDKRTCNPSTSLQGSTASAKESPDNPDCFYLAPITSAAR